MRAARLEPLYDYRLWLRALVVVAVLLAAAYLGRKPSPLYLYALLGAGGLVALLRWPPLGLLALVAAALLVPFAVGTGTGTSLNAAVLLVPALLGLATLDMLKRRDLGALSARPMLPLALLCVVAVIAFLAGSQPWILFAETASLASQAGGLAIFLLSAAAFLLAAHWTRDERWLQALTWLFIALGAVFVAGRVAEPIGQLTDRLFQAGASGSLFWTWLVALAFGQAAFNQKLAPILRLALAGVVAAALYDSLAGAEAWLSGWLPAVVALVVALVAGAPRLALPTMAIGAVVGAVNLDRVSAFLSAGDNAFSLVTRLAAWRIVAEITSASPLIGLGPSNYYFYTPLFPILGYAVSFNSHNNYVDIAAETGLLGLACFLWLAFAVGWLAWRARARVPAGFGRGYLYGAIGGLAGTLAAMGLGDWFIPFVYNIGFTGFRASVLGWIFLGGLVALANTYSRRGESGVRG